MNYLESGFNENLIRAGYSGQQNTGQIDTVNAGEVIIAGAVPISEVTNALTSAEIINADYDVIVDLINENLNTQAATILGAFSFGASGAIQIGTYSAGVTGDIRISPNGIVGRNASNVTTFSIDGTTGNAGFLGTVYAGSVIAATIAASLITAGTINSQIITMGITAGTGDAAIRAGKTDFDNTQSGFILGLDDSDSDTPKFYVGNTTKYLNWDGSALTIRGTLNADDIVAGTLTGRTIKATGGAGTDVWMESSTGQLLFRYGSSDKAYIYVNSSGQMLIDADESIFIQADGAGDDLAFVAGDDVLIEAGGTLILAGDMFFDGDITQDGAFTNTGNIRCGGTFESSDGSDGITTTRDIVMSVYNGGSNYAYRTFTFKDGLLTNVGSEQTTSS